MTALRSQRGAALITALLVVAMAATLAGTLMWRLDLWLRHVDTHRDLAQARQLASAGLQWACAVLADDARTSSIDHAREPWGTKVPQMPAEGGEIGGELTDEQGKWSLNNLVSGTTINKSELEVFRRLLSLLQLPPERAIDAAVWLGGVDETGLAGGAGDDYYLALKPPYRRAKREFGVIDNLLRVRGFDPAIVERLRPYVTALPGYNRVNVNTATALVVAAELPGLSLSDATQLVANRDRIPLRDMNDFRNRLSNPAAVEGDYSTRLDTRSRWFTARIQARYGRATVAAAALLDRQRGWPEIAWQEWQ